MFMQHIVEKQKYGVHTMGVHAHFKATSKETWSLSVIIKKALLLCLSVLVKEGMAFVFISINKESSY